MIQHQELGKRSLSNQIERAPRTSCSASMQPGGVTLEVLPEELLELLPLMQQSSISISMQGFFRTSKLRA